MAVYRCCNKECDNCKEPVSLFSDNDTVICDICGATMMKQKEKDLQNPKFSKNNPYTGK